MPRLAAKGLFALDLSTETGHADVGDVLGLSIDLIHCPSLLRLAESSEACHCTGYIAEDSRGDSWARSVVRERWWKAESVRRTAEP